MIFNAEDIGNVVIDKDGNVFRVMSYSDRPSVMVKNIETNREQHFSAQCPLADDFDRLVREEIDKSKSH